MKSFYELLEVRDPGYMTNREIQIADIEIFLEKLQRGLFKLTYSDLEDMSIPDLARWLEKNVKDVRDTLDDDNFFKTRYKKWKPIHPLRLAATIKMYVPVYEKKIGYKIASRRGEDIPEPDLRTQRGLVRVRPCARALRPGGRGDGMSR